MRSDEKRHISFPMIAGYEVAIRYLMEQGLDTQFVMPPQMTRRTLELGDRYSPDFVCTPFKSTLGSMIEALEGGADTLVMTHGLCRLGYYGELQQLILRDLGYKFDFINLAEYSRTKRDFLKVMKRINPHYKVRRLMPAALDMLKMVEYLDEVEAEYYRNCGFEREKGSYRKAYGDFLKAMSLVTSRAEINAAYKAVKLAFHDIPLDKPANPLRVGIVGEYYTVMDAFSNLELEQKLADMGVEVHRWMNFSNRNLHYSGEKNLNIRINDLVKYEMGPTSTATIWCTRDYAERGFDGIIHVKSAGCTPEIDVMPVLQNISADSKVPILYLTYDTQTSDTGLITRIEAFYDMLQMRKVN